MKMEIPDLEKHNHSECKCVQYEKRLFTHIEYSENINLDKNKPKVEQILSTVTEPEIISVRIVDTIRGISSEGEHLSGRKVVVILKVREKILYSSGSESKTIHVVENEYYHSAHLAIPQNIEGTNPEVLIKHNYLRPRIMVEDVSIRVASPNTIFKYICLLFELSLMPTLELCYTIQEHNSSESMFASFNDGTHNTELISFDNTLDIKPEWSPSGQEIAFISKDQDISALCLISIKDLRRREIGSHIILKTISGFCWSADGRSIVFSSMINGMKELFVIDTQNGKWNQLTCGRSNIKSYKPRCSPKGKYLGFLRAVSGVANLHIQSMGGMDCRKITSSGHIKDFTWSSDDETIACVRDKDGDPDEIFTVDINTLSEKKLNLCKGANRKRDIKFSPDGSLIAFIGTTYNTDDIYLIDVNSNKASNLTKNSSGISISSFCWNADSNRIYYSSNENYYYNIYSISITHNCRHQLTNTNASGIKLCYRPRIR